MTKVKLGTLPLGATFRRMSKDGEPLFADWVVTRHPEAGKCIVEATCFTGEIYLGDLRQDVFVYSHDIDEGKA